MSLFRDTGVVLRTYRLGEADRIVVFLTERHGKVRAVAKGVRRTTSKFGARLEPLTHVDLLLWQGRSDLDIVNQVEVLDSFRPVREDLTRLPRGLALVEVADQLAQERQVSEQINALAATAREELDFAAEQFVQWFIAEQIEEVATMSDLLAVAERSRDRVAEIEDFLAREHPGEDGPDAAAPRQAGGL